MFKVDYFHPTEEEWLASETAEGDVVRVYQSADQVGAAGSKSWIKGCHDYCEEMNEPNPLVAQQKFVETLIGQYNPPVLLVRWKHLDGGHRTCSRTSLHERRLFGARVQVDLASPVPKPCTPRKRARQGTGTGSRWPRQGSLITSE